MPVADQPHGSAVTSMSNGRALHELAEGEGFGEAEGGFEDDTIRVRIPAAPR